MPGTLGDHHVGSENETRSPARVANVFTTEPFLAPRIHIFNLYL